MSRLIQNPFRAGQWRLAMGLQPLLLEDWIEIGADVLEQLTLKTQLLCDRPAEVFGSISGSELAQQEVLNLLINHLLRYFPQYYWQQGEVIHNSITGQVWRISDFATSPLDLAGRLVQEDLCLMLPQDGYCLAAASLCFPSRWRLQEKLGHPLAVIHHSVPGYAEKLEQPVNQVFDRLKTDYPAYRFNWSIADSPDLFLEPSHHSAEFNPAITSHNAGRLLWLRVERQTLRRLPISQGILFTIRTYVHPLSQLTDDPVAVRNLISAICSMPIEMKRYKSILPFEAALLDYLKAYAM